MTTVATRIDGSAGPVESFGPAVAPSLVASMHAVADPGPVRRRPRDGRPRPLVETGHR